jgi:hypothetical protein
MFSKSGEVDLEHKAIIGDSEDALLPRYFHLDRIGYQGQR